MQLLLMDAFRTNFHFFSKNILIFIRKILEKDVFMQFVDIRGISHQNHYIWVERVKHKTFDTYIM